MRLLALTLCAAFLSAPLAHAVAAADDDAVFDAQLTKDYADCRKGEFAMRPLQHCTALELERQQAMLDKALEARRARLPDDAARARLDRDQKAWEASKDEKCRPLTRGRGSMRASEAQYCFLHAIVRRRLELER